MLFIHSTGTPRLLLSIPTRRSSDLALVAKLVLQPSAYDVIVGSNLFGDILSDLAAAIAGSIGIAPAANLNPEREFPDRKSTRLNSSHLVISYAVFCLKKKMAHTNND